MFNFLTCKRRFGTFSLISRYSFLYRLFTDLTGYGIAAFIFNPVNSVSKSLWSTLKFLSSFHIESQIHFHKVKFYTHLYISDVF